MGDQIVAGPDGLAQIRFIDNTRLVVGPNSRLTINSFIFDRNDKAKKVTINALKGAFRFISGDSPHQAYTLKTPTMEIGFRGTVVDINARGPELDRRLPARIGNGLRQRWKLHRRHRRLCPPCRCARRRDHDAIGLGDRPAAGGVLPVYHGPERSRSGLPRQHAQLPYAGPEDLRRAFRG